MPRLARLSLCLLPAVLLLSGPRASEAQERRAEHVVLISVDGLRPEFYLDPSWPAPLMQHLAKEGAHAKAVRSVFPSVTYPSHTTLITGALPARHGILYNRPFEPTGYTGSWYWEAKKIKVPTLWDAVRAAKRESASVSWPVSVGAPVDRNVPEVWSTKRSEPRLKAMQDATTPGLWEEIEREATGRLRPSLINLDSLARDIVVGQMAAYLLETHKPALLTIHLVETDHYMHVHGREHIIVRRAVACADSAIGLIHEAAKRADILEKTAIIVTGDHGFVDIHTRIAPNVWLVAAGLQETKGTNGEWRATFHTTGGAALLRVKDPSEEEAVVKEVRAILDALPPGMRRTFRLVEKKELRAIGADPDSPLALAAVPGFCFTASTKAPDQRAASGGTHGYFPEFQQAHTGFIGWGSGFRKGAVAPQLHLEDVAPIVAELLDIPFEAPDGVVPRGLLESAKH